MAGDSESPTARGERRLQRAFGSSSRHPSRRSPRILAQAAALRRQSPHSDQISESEVKEVVQVSLKRKHQGLTEQSRKRVQTATAQTYTTASPGICLDEDDTNSSIRRWAEDGVWSGPRVDEMNHLLARKPPLRRKRSDSSFTSIASSDQALKEEESGSYRNPSYPTLLEDVGSHMCDHKLGLASTSKELCRRLRDSKHQHPQDTLFRDDIFDTTCRKLKGKNEARIIQDLSPLIVPSPEALATFGAEHLDHVVESVNEGWNDCIPVTKSRPQPDAAFGLAKSILSDHQLDKLRPYTGAPGFTSYFKGTFYMLFPFFTKEVKCGAMGLDVADNQNAHSMTLAVRALVELYKLVGRETQLHREIVAVSLSHDDQSVRIHAWYPVIEGSQYTIWRHTIDQFYIGPDTKWTARNLVVNCLEILLPLHMQRVRSAVDDLQKVTPEVVPSNRSGLSRDLGDSSLATAEQEVGSLRRSQQLTPDSSRESGSKRRK